MHKLYYLLLVFALSNYACRTSEKSNQNIIVDKGEAFVLSPKPVNDTTYFLIQEYPDNQFLYLFESDTTGIPSYWNKFFTNGYVGMYDNKSLLESTKTMKKEIDTTLLKTLQGKYIDASFLNNEFYFSANDNWAGNHGIEITNHTILDIIGFEGYHKQPIINVFKETENIIVIESMKYSYDLNQANSTTFKIDTIKFNTKLSNKGIYIVEDCGSEYKNFFYLIKDDYFNKYKALKCRSTSGPCYPDLLQYLRDLTKEEINRIEG